MRKGKRIIWLLYYSRKNQFQWRGISHVLFRRIWNSCPPTDFLLAHKEIHKEGLILFTWPSDDNVFFYFFGHGVVWLVSQGSPQINKGDFINANNRGVCFLEYGFAVFQNGLSPQYLETNRSTYPIYFILFLAVNICGDELSHLTYQMILDEVRDYYSLSFFFAFLF